VHKNNNSIVKTEIIENTKQKKIEKQQMYLIASAASTTSHLALAPLPPYLCVCCVMLPG
jgi:hypothetical protein